MLREPNKFPQQQQLTVSWRDIVIRHAARAKPFDDNSKDLQFSIAKVDIWEDFRQF